MGRIPTQKAGLAGALFSRVQLRVLSLLFGQPDRSFHASEIIRLAGSGSGAVQRELEKLAASGILLVTESANRKLYQANRQSPIFEELHGLIAKTTGLVEPLRHALKPFTDAIDVAFVYGSVAKGKDTAKSDIDLMIVGKELAYSPVYAALQKAEKILLRPVNPNLMSPGDWKWKRADKGSFVSKIIQQPKLFILGSDDELKGIGQPCSNGLLKPEPGDHWEFDGLVASGTARLADARVKGLSLEGQFDLAYSAAHAFSLAALRWHGYRPEKRFVVFQALQHTLGLKPEIWRVLDKSHKSRNLAEYEGTFDVDAQLLSDLLKVTDMVHAAVEKIAPISKSMPKTK